MKQTKLIVLLLISLIVICSCQTVTIETTEAYSTVTTNVAEIDRFGNSFLNFSASEIYALGYELGDIVTVGIGDTQSYDMPFFNGFYGEVGDMVLRAYPGTDYLSLCISYGKFAEFTGVTVGSEVSISMKEKAGELGTQTVMALVYSNDKADFDSDVTFANFREIETIGIAPGVLYRSCSPINNENSRAAIANSLVEAVGINSVMNLADTPKEIEEYSKREDFHSEYYKELFDRGNVIALGMPVNFQSAEFAKGIVEGLTFLSEHEVPYLIHCTEGKDRAGFTSALLEALMGASKEEIIADYMKSYENYYGVEEGSDKYQIIVDKNIVDMLHVIGSADSSVSLDDIDFAKGAEEYLLSNGMNPKSLMVLKSKLSK